MDAYLEQQEQALAYLKGEMTSEERSAFEEKLARSADLRSELESSRELLDLMTAANEESIVLYVNALIRRAVDAGASDIHIVPGRNETEVLFRVDGVRHVVETRPREAHQAMIDRLKTMAECNLRERLLPQDGRIAVTTREGGEFDLRVSFLPTIYGERATVRILDRGNVLVGLERLGLSEGHLAALRRLAGLPNGLVITSGPTGSGKSTLLYSLLLHIRDTFEQPNILTVEDPVELALDRISQVMVRRAAGLTFPVAQRCILRSDPDVVMVGQMRSLESAELAIETALTGHLVLSVLHTASALGIPGRLREMGVVPFLVAQTVRGCIAQRLARRICTGCVVAYTPRESDLRPLGLTAADGPFYRGAGCEACRKTGYRGRIGLFEVWEAEEALRPLLTENTPVEVLWAETFGKRGGSLLDDGRDKVRQGLTTAEEVVRTLFDYPLPAR